MTYEDINNLIEQRKNSIWQDIEKLSELKANYNCFDESEEPYYRALSNAIQALRNEIDRLSIVRNGSIRL